MRLTPKFVDLRLVFCGIALTFACSSSPASMVIGSETFSVKSTKLLDSTSVTTATQFKFSGIKTTDPSDGDFTVVASGTIASAGPDTLILTPLSFSFGNGSFGTFTATSLVYDVAGPTFRNLEFLGTFTGGTMFPGMIDPAQARLDIGLTQVGGNKRPVSASFSLVTIVPEPGSVILLGIGLIAPILTKVSRRNLLPCS